MSAEILQPPQWAMPKGYSNGMAVSGRQIFIAGQVGWNERQEFPSERMADQLRLALANIVAILAQANARPEHLVRLTWFVTSREEYLAQVKEIGVAWREVIGRHYPTMSVVQVVALIEAKAKVEIEATAVVPDTGV